MSTAGLQRTLDQIARIPAEAIGDACKAVEKIARDVGGSVGPVRFGNGRSSRLTAVSRVKGRGTTEAAATVWGRPTGPWVWATSGTGGHTIPKAGRRGRGKARGTRYLKGDRYEHPYGKPVHHPGSGGRGAWRRVRSRAETEVPKVYADAVRKVIGRG